jgi:hypothetical protein
MIEAINKFIENLLDYGLEYFGRFYGIYIGKVFSNADPGGMGRIMVSVPSVSGKNILGNPARPTSPYAGKDHGIYFPPEKDEMVLVWFENGDPRFPWYIGGFWTSDDEAGESQDSSELPEEFRCKSQPGKDWKGKQEDGKAPTIRGIKILNIDGDKSFLLTFDRTKDEENIKLIHPELSQMEFDKDGSIIVKDTNENQIFLDTPNKEIVITNIASNENIITLKGESITIEHKGGSKITMQGGDITIESDDNLFVKNGTKVDVETKEVEVKADSILLGGGAAEKMVLGNVFKSWVDNHINSVFNMHIHGTGMGPTSPPQVPAQPPSDACYSDRVFGKK